MSLKLSVQGRDSSERAAVLHQEWPLYPKQMKKVTPRICSWKTDAAIKSRYLFPSCFCARSYHLWPYRRQLCSGKKYSEILYELFLKVTCRHTRPSEHSTNADCYISPHPMGDLVTSSTAINLLVFYSFSPFLFFLLYASKLLFSREVY